MIFIKIIFNYAVLFSKTKILVTMVSFLRSICCDNSRKKTFQKPKVFI